MKVAVEIHLCCLQDTTSAVAWSWEVSHDLGDYPNFASQQLRWIYDVFSAWDQLCGGCHHTERPEEGGTQDATPEPPFLAMAQLRHTLKCAVSLSPESLSKWTCTVKIAIFLIVKSIDMNGEAKKNQCGIVSVRWGEGGANIKHIWPNQGAADNYGRS